MATGISKKNNQQHIPQDRQRRGCPPLQNRPKLLVGRAGLSHQKVIPHRTLKQITLMADIRNVFHQICFPYIPKLFAADFH